MGSHVYTANGTDGSVSIFETAGHTLVRDVAVGRGPWAVDASNDGALAFTADRWSRTVTVLGPRPGL